MSPVELLKRVIDRKAPIAFSTGWGTEMIELFRQYQVRREGLQRAERLIEAQPFPWGDASFKALSTCFQAHSLGPSDVAKIGLAACKRFTREKTCGTMGSRADQVHLEHLRTFFGLDERWVTQARSELSRSVLLSELQAGILPTIYDPTFALAKGEVLHWQQSCELLEERVVSRSYKGGSHGVNLRIAKGVHYRVGQHRGHFVSKRAEIPVSEGTLLVTSTRVSFAGDKKSFSQTWEKIFRVEIEHNHLLVIPSSGNTRVLATQHTHNFGIIKSIAHLCLLRAHS